MQLLGSLNSEFNLVNSTNLVPFATRMQLVTAPRQPEQLPDYTLMYAHIRRLAILHISTLCLFVH